MRINPVLKFSGLVFILLFCSCECKQVSRSRWLSTGSSRKMSELERLSSEIPDYILQISEILEPKLKIVSSLLRKPPPPKKGIISRYFNRKNLALCATVCVSGIAVSRMYFQQMSAYNLFPTNSINNLLWNRLSVVGHNGTVTYRNASLSGEDDSHTLLIFDWNASTVAESKFRFEQLEMLSKISMLSHSVGRKFELVYVPHENVPHAIESSSSFRPLSWKFLSSKLADKELVRVVREKYAIPDGGLRLVVLDSAGRVLSDRAEELFRISPQSLPWPPRLVQEEVLSGPVLDPNETIPTVPLNTTNKTVALFFSASWCEPCKKVLPLLNASLDDLRSRGVDVVLVSLDKSEDEFDRYRGSLRFPAVPYKDSRRLLLQSGLGVRAIPSLIVLRNNSVVTSSGVPALLGGDDRLWEEGVLDLSAPSNIQQLQYRPVLIAFTEHCDSLVKDSVKDALEECRASVSFPVTVPRLSRNDLMVGTVEEASRVSEVLRTLCGMPDARSNIPQFAILDLSTERAFGNLTWDTDSFRDMLATGALKTTVVDALEDMTTRFLDYSLQPRKVDIGSLSI